MSNIKDYRTDELKHYVIANLLILFLIHNKLNFSSNEDVIYFSTIINLLNIAIVISALYVFIFLSDSLFSSDLKFKLLYLGSPKPGEIIFTKLLTKTNDMRFSNEFVQQKYHIIYENMPKNKQKNRTYQNQQWYKIYSLNKTAEMVSISAKEFRLCRDMYISTISLLLIYLISCFGLRILNFRHIYCIYLLIMIFLTNWAARTKGKRWVYNAIAYDLTKL